MKTYAEKLRDPRWQKRRLEVMERDRFTCFRCRSTDKTLNVHHLMYEKGKSPWDYNDSALVTLCEDCHKEVEDLECKLAFGAFMAARGMNLNTARLVLSYAALAAGVTECFPAEICGEMLRQATVDQAVSHHVNKRLAEYKPGTIEQTIEALR